MKQSDLNLIKEALGEEAAKQFALLMSNSQEPKKVKKPSLYRDRDSLWDGTFRFGVNFPTRVLTPQDFIPLRDEQFTNVHPLYKNLCVRFKGREPLFCKCIVGNCIDKEEFGYNLL